MQDKLSSLILHHLRRSGTICVAFAISICTIKLRRKNIGIVRVYTGYRLHKYLILCTETVNYCSIRLHTCNIAANELTYLKATDGYLSHYSESCTIWQQKLIDIYMQYFIELLRNLFFAFGFYETPIGKENPIVNTSDICIYT